MKRFLLLGARRFLRTNSLQGSPTLASCFAMKRHVCFQHRHFAKQVSQEENQKFEREKVLLSQAKQFESVHDFGRLAKTLSEIVNRVNRNSFEALYLLSRYHLAHIHRDDLMNAATNEKQRTLAGIASFIHDLQHMEQPDPATVEKLSALVCQAREASPWDFDFIYYELKLTQNEQTMLKIREHLDQFLKTNPNSADAATAHFFKSFTFAKREQNQRLVSLSEAIKLNPSHADALMERAHTLATMPVDKKFKTRDLESVISLNPNHVPALLILAEERVNQGESTKALQLVEHVLKVEPANEAAQSLLLKVYYEVEHNLDKLFSAIDAYAQRVSSDANSSTDKAMYLLAFGKFDEVIQFCEQEIQLYEQFKQQQQQQQQQFNQQQDQEQKETNQQSIVEQVGEIIESIVLVKSFAQTVQQGFQRFPALYALFTSALQQPPFMAQLNKQNLLPIYSETSDDGQVKDVESWSLLCDCVAFLAHLGSPTQREAVVHSSIFKNLLQKQGKQNIQVLSTNAYVNYLLFVDLVSNQTDCHLNNRRFEIVIDGLQAKAKEDKVNPLDIIVTALESPHLSSLYNTPPDEKQQ